MGYKKYLLTHLTSGPHTVDVFVGDAALYGQKGQDDLALLDELQQRGENSDTEQVNLLMLTVAKTGLAI